MQKVLSWGVPNITEISNENVGSILLNIKPVDSNGNIVTQQNLNKIEISLTLKRGEDEAKTIFDGYLGDLLQFLYAGSTKLSVAQKHSSTLGFLVNLEFEQRFNLSDQDVLTVKTDFRLPSNAFPTATLSNSSIVLYTNPSSVPNPNNYVSVYKAFQVPNSDVDFERHLGTNVSKVIFHSHPTNSFEQQLTDNVPTPITMELIADDYHEDKSVIELIARSRMASAYNPETVVQNLVQYNSNRLLTNVRLKSKLTFGANVDTKILVTSIKVM